VTGLWLPIAVLLVGGGILFQAYATWRGWQIVRGARQRRPRDATGQAGLLPAELGKWHDELRALGFSRLGEVAIDLPGEGRPHYSWVLVDESGTVEVELVTAGAPLLSFVTTFGDGAAVQTMLPRGESIRRDDFASIVERGSLAAAVDRHRAEVAAFAARHGRPLLVRTMADHLRHDVTYRERHAHRFLMPPFLRETGKGWLVLAIAAAGVLYLAMGSR
jgi:hypothetical protein